MTVLFQNLGGGGGVAFPPKGTQVAFFEETFRRPPLPTEAPPKDGDSLGPLWATWWLTADWAEDKDDVTALSRINPGIRGAPSNPAGAFILNQAGGMPCFTACAPWPLAWITQERPGRFTSHYTEMRMTEKPPGDDWELFTMVAFSGDPGTRAYNPGVNLQSGFFAVTFGPHSDPGLTSTRVCFYLMPTTPQAFLYGTPPQTGQSLQLVWSFDLADAPLGTMKRIEAHFMEGGNWTLRVYFDGVLQTQTIRYQELGSGMPAMGAMIFPDIGDPIPQPRVNYFQAGWIPE